MSIKFPIRLTALAALLPAASLQAAQQGLADLAAIEASAAQFLASQGEGGQGSLVPLDRRLRLAACEGPLDLGWYGQSRASIEVRCPDAGGWRIFVQLAGGETAPAARTASAAPVVIKGDGVSITVSGKGFSVTRSGEALENGRPGQWIKVRVAKGSDVRAQVLREGAVGMVLP